eukprot:Gb_25894 [translate_table: standard]
MIASLSPFYSLSGKKLWNIEYWQGIQLTLMNQLPLKSFALILAGLLLISGFSLTHGDIDAEDVMAINVLYMSLGSPTLAKWISNAGDPCGENWEGVQCVGPNITGMFLSGNQFTGSLPYSLSTLTFLSDLMINNNLLTGAIPDIFGDLTGLINLNIENNLFTWWVPPKLLTIPNFKYGGSNQFLSSLAPPLPPFTTPSSCTSSSRSPGHNSSPRKGSHDEDNGKYLTSG